MAGATDRRLDSWKKIADHLGRDVRTAIRWERERGLPVHRVPGAKRGSVFAFTDEIDGWLLSVDPDSRHSRQADAPEPAEPETRPSKAPRRVRWFALGAASLVIGVFAAALLGANGARGRLSEVAAVAAISLEGTALTAFDQRHDALWKHDFGFGRKVLATEDPPDDLPPRLFASGDLDGDGIPEVVVSVRFGTPTASRGEIFAFSSRGRLLWSYAVDDVLTFGGGEFRPPWRGLSTRDAGAQVAVFDLDGQKRVASVQSHQTWWPSILTVLDGAGRPLSRWVHSGVIYTVVPIVTRSGPRLVVGGVSNSREAAFMAVLDARTPDGAGPEEPGSTYECLTCGPGRPLHYFTIQPSEQIRPVAPYNSVNEIRPSEDGIEVRTRDSAPSSLMVQGVLRYSFDFTLEHAAWSSAWAAGHRDLERLGKIDHSVNHCPEHDRPPHVRGWTKAGGWRNLTPPINANGSTDGRPGVRE